MKFIPDWLDILIAFVLLPVAIYAIAITLMTLSAAGSLLPWANPGQ